MKAEKPKSDRRITNKELVQLGYSILGEKYWKEYLKIAKFQGLHKPTATTKEGVKELSKILKFHPLHVQKAINVYLSEFSELHKQQ